MVARSRIVGAATAVVLVALLGRLLFLQAAAGDGLDREADGNRTRIVVREGPRGRILDRDGVVLAGNRTSLVVTLDLRHLSDLPEPDRRRVLDAVAAELTVGGEPVTADELIVRYDRELPTAIAPVVVADDIDAETWLAIEERQLAGVAIERRPVRTYPHGRTASHLLGHLGTVADPDEAATLAASHAAVPHTAEPWPTYQAGDTIGRSGIELWYEPYLRGTPEVVRVELDATNRVVGEEVVQTARPGADVHLAIDVELQQAAERAIESALTAARSPSPGDEPLTAPAGSMVALDPGDGTVVALASFPDFDPTWFVDGLTDRQAAWLFDDDRAPLLNRAVAGLYPAGSTFKPVTAYAALVAGARQADDEWLDGGTYRIGNCRATVVDDDCVVTNAGSVALGPVDLVSALARSSDTYFYSLGEALWADRDRFGSTPIQDVARRLGLGSLTGIDLGGEVAGTVPAPGPGRPWHTGDNLNLAIGQGDLLVTPLQLANLYAGLASGGERYRPRLVVRIVDGVSGRVLMTTDPAVVDDAWLDPAFAGPIGDGLLSATVEGTAAGAFAGSPLPLDLVGGKTGTAQVTGRDDFALYAAVAPWQPSGGDRYAVAAVLEEAGFGARSAAPAVRTFLDLALTGTPPSPPVEPLAPEAPSPEVEASPGVLVEPPVEPAGAGR